MLQEKVSTIFPLTLVKVSVKAVHPVAAPHPHPLQKILFS